MTMESSIVFVVSITSIPRLAISGDSRIKKFKKIVAKFLKDCYNILIKGKEMKHYTSSELIEKMYAIGYAFAGERLILNDEIAFYASDNGFKSYRIVFDNWKAVGDFYKKNK